MNDQIARAIANVTIFLEFASDETLDADVAIQALEQLGGDLYALDEVSRRTLCASFRSIAPTYDGEIRTFVEELPEAFGLEEPQDDKS